jgi:uncharacterized delta-60 repeat protein
MPELGIFLGAITNRAYGYTTPARWEFNGNIYAITPEVNPSNGEPTGKIYVGGAFTKYNDITVNRIVKLNIDGTIDSTFDIGIGTTNIGFNYTTTTVLSNFGAAESGVYKILQESGSNKIYVCGSISRYKNTPLLSRMVKLNSDGTIDSGFTPPFTSNQIGNNGMFYTMCYVSGSNQIYVGGRTSVNIGGISRLNSDGSIDSTFNTGDGATKGFSPAANSNIIPIVYSIMQESGSNRIYVGGFFNQYSGSASESPAKGISGVVRLNSNGTRDTTFVAQLNNQVLALAQESGSSKIYVGGAFSQYANSPNPSPTWGTIPSRLIRLNSNGSRDTSFLAGTGGGMSSTVFSIIQVPNSTDIYLGGAFTFYTTGSRSFTQNSISRLTSTASTSSLANFGTGFNNTVFALAPSGSNGLYVGGAFNSYQNSPANFFAKLIPSS